MDVRNKYSYKPDASGCTTVFWTLHGKTIGLLDLFIALLVWMLWGPSPHE